MPATLRYAPALRSIAEQLIETRTVFEEGEDKNLHGHLLDPEFGPPRMEFIWRDDVPKKGGKSIIGQVRIITSMAAFFARPDADEDQDEGGAPPFFVVCISEPLWNGLEPHQQMAALDAELCKCGVKKDKDGNVKLFQNDYDFHGFHANVREFGLWLPDYQKLDEAMESHRQPRLDFDQPAHGITEVALKNGDGPPVVITAETLKKAAALEKEAAESAA